MKPGTKKKPIQASWVIGGIILLLLISVGAYFFIQYTTSQKKEKEAETVMHSFVEALEKQEYEKVSSFLDPVSLKKQETTKENIAERYETVFGGIGIANMEAREIHLIQNEETKEYSAEFILKMDSALGELPEQKYSFDLNEQEDTFFVAWSPHLFFPQMEEGDTVHMERSNGVRGNILDRHGELLAGQGKAFQAGMHPVQLGEGPDKSDALEEIADVFEISVEKLEQALSQEWVTEESFVPFALRDEGDTPQVKGVLYQETTARLYPLKEAAAHLIGYTGSVTAEDIEKNPSLQPDEQIGKSGLEATLNDRLQGKPGGKITILDKDKNLRHVLKETEAEDGETITLTIDKTLQEDAYSQFQEETGAAVVIAPTNGELLVLTSAPSFNPVKMSRGISSKEYNAYAEDERSPFLARYSARYAPGSTFKLLTGAIGLDAGTLDPNETLKIEGLKWTKDASWGSDAVTRVSEQATDVNLQTAYVYSDNIYFAKQALKMGGDTFKKGLESFPFGEKLEIPVSMEPAQITKNGEFTSEKQIADTAYGQGELLMSPIHQALFYSAIQNEGILPIPTLILEEGTEKTGVSVVSKEAATTVKEMLRQVVQDPNGSAHELADLNLPIGAKTGTAEVNGPEGMKTNGFVTVMDLENSHFQLLSLLENHSSGDVVKTFKPYIKKLMTHFSP